MEDGWTSDWDRLFAKCATDPDYRARLDEALGEEGTRAAADLLRSIGIKGHGGSNLDAEVSVLKAARDPMNGVAEALGPIGPRVAG